MQTASPPEATLFVVSDNLATLPAPACDGLAPALDVDVRTLPALERPMQPVVREIGLLSRPPWVRPLGKLAMDVRTQGWKFPVPGAPPPPNLQIFRPDRPPPSPTTPAHART